MMDYVAFKRFKGKGLNGDSLNIAYGDRLYAIDNFIFNTKGQPVCFRSSEVAHKYFAIDGDGRGLERGAYVFAIAYKVRKTKEGFRFTEAERNLLCRKWKRYLRTDTDMLLFNRQFFDAPIADLAQMAADLNIKVD
jgi:hypothetical protein